MTETMNGRLQRQTFDPKAMVAIYGSISPEMTAVEELLSRELNSDYPYVNELIQHGCLLGGKRIRPALLLLVAKSLGRTSTQHVTLAAVVEMIHTATLVHDDVLDEAETRRHIATVNSRWDSKASVLLGDFLFTHAFYLASTLDSTWACREIGRATNIVCEGELRQKGCRGDLSLSEAEYLSIIEAKTAELIACSCRLGAHYAGAGENLVGHVAAFGRNIGIAFQIVDDVLDLLGEEDTTGKTLGTDLEQQKLTLPLIHTLRQADTPDRREIEAILADETPQRRADLKLFLDRYQGVQYARDRAAEFVDAAKARLANLPESSFREQLATLADFVLSRPK